MGVCQFWVTTQLREPGSDFSENGFHNIISRTESGGLPWIWTGMFGYVGLSFVGSFPYGEGGGKDPKTGVVFAALNVPDLFFVWVGFKKFSSNTGILNP